MKLFKLPPDAKGFEKFVYLFVPVFVIAIIGWFYLSAFQILHNKYQIAASQAPVIWRILGVVCLGLAVFVYRKIIKDEWAYSIGTILLIGILLLLGTQCNIGWHYPYQVAFN